MAGMVMHVYALCGAFEWRGAVGGSVRWKFLRRLASPVEPLGDTENGNGEFRRDRDDWASGHDRR